jgi:ABC-2 type transport system permease protein
MQYICRALPPSYIFENVRAIVAGGQASIPELVVGALLAVLDVILACWIFVSVYRHSVRTGLIARYSAESVS